jgi:type IV pilus assembly protein PilB
VRGIITLSSKRMLERWPSLENTISNSSIDMKMVELLVKEGKLPKDDVLHWIGEQLNCKTINLKQWYPNETWQQELLSTTSDYQVFPVSFSADEITVATSDPMQMNVKDELSLITDKKITFIFTFENDITWAIEQFKTIDERIIGNNDPVEQQEKESLRSKGSTEVIDTIISKAVGQNISDIHIEAKEHGSVIRFRRDGMLIEHDSFPKDFHPILSAQIKVLAKLDIAEKRIPQDGRFKYSYQERHIRVSTLPTYYGEKIVLRLLDQKGSMLSLEQLGFSSEFIGDWKNTLQSPHGLVLVTGPTGSGKTTTLYSSLAEIDTTGKNIVTLEDPIEYALPFANQVQVNPKIGLTFAKGLRSVLRQDPDVILLGEIRDLETAQFAIQASLTGHFVLSTLHTNSPEGAIVRLHDMGIPPYLIASSVLGVLSQRLLRKVCENCKVVVEHNADYEVATQYLGMRVDKLVKGIGCNYCQNTGYSGRIAYYDFISVTDEMKDIIIKQGSEKDIRKQVGYKQVNHYLHNLLNNGTTSLEEVVRVIGRGSSDE